MRQYGNKYDDIPPKLRAIINRMDYGSATATDLYVKLTELTARVRKDIIHAANLAAQEKLLDNP